MGIEFQEAMFHCPSHPSEEVVGICASCLRDRLYCLKRKNKLRRASLQNISYSSDSDSCLEFDELRLGNFDPLDNKEIVARKKFLWLTKTKNPRSSSQKGKRTFFSLRSIFHRLRRNKEETKPDICISHEDSFISIKLDGNGNGNERSQWECRTVGSSARSSSVCEGKWSFYEPVTLRGNGSCNEKGGGGKEEEEEEERASSTSSHGRVRWRTRMNALVRKKGRMQDKVFSECHNQYNPNPKIWSLSSLYNNYHESRHCMTSSNGTKKGWLRNLTSPKWSLH